MRWQASRVGTECTGIWLSWRKASALAEPQGYQPSACPIAGAAETEVVWLRQRVLLGGGEDMEDIAVAMDEVVRGLTA
ncbi:MAG TPA: hypothetical protein VIA06_04385 [Candidatus Dormibacteraeota bacterium]|jgi:hypothetical protein|nr:hypothetical protein [Candidatus Dormibacteraeota bacterium]